ncbi:MAG TPA: substrate-binding domain-containing protein [Solirubrobacterales bacterium]|nr:substrate-binding domain-containing protein [Solirubrobacterales bacterium]
MKTRHTMTLLGLMALFAALTLGISACGDSDATGEGDSPDVFLMTLPPGDDWAYTLEKAAKKEAKHLGVNLEIQQEPNFEPSAQVSILNAAMAKNPDAILVQPLSVDALQAPLERAVDRGIKVITYDLNTGEPDGVVSTFVGADYGEIGKKAAELIVDEIGGEGKVFYQGGATGISQFDLLRETWKETMDQQPGIVQLPPVYSNFEPAKANSQMAATLTAHPDVAGGFASVIYDQEGIVPALERAGKIGKVKLVGLDGAPGNIQRLREGAVQTIISVRTVDFGTTIIQAAVEAIEGKDLPAETRIGHCVLTAENVDDPENSACIYEKAP